ncbi:hypothetical protein B6R96_03335 [Streptomyces sp. Sge12]|uniref:hypothetical protein n=1 Tax=Streptomyces sp. Sge12 TaxID=1972846 RepID=UPI0009C32C9B|nr:hypothetical protein [Streptomyces sp. Sge12]ARE73086.1 hypothetical protein B6R96_03335 [Streptomyces sp. Sge12]
MTTQQDPLGPVGRLAAHRELDPGGLARRAEAEENEVRAVLRGSSREPDVLRRLAPVLGLHAGDLFVLAGAPVPEDLAPLDAAAGRSIPCLVRRFVSLPPEARDEVLCLVRSLPQEERTAPVPVPRPYEEYPPGFGGVLLRMLANRNLNWNGSVRVLHTLAGLYVSAATIGGVGRGTVELTHHLLADFAIVLGIPVGDLTAMAGPVAEGGRRLSDPVPVLHSAGPDAAVLIRELSRLSAGQVRRVDSEAGAALGRTS